MIFFKNAIVGFLASFLLVGKGDAQETAHHSLQEDYDYIVQALDIGAIERADTFGIDADFAEEIDAFGVAAFASHYDLNIRFNKFKYNDDVTRRFRELSAKDYPLRPRVARRLQKKTNAVSVVVADDNAVPNSYKVAFDGYLEEIGGLPSMPSSDPHSPFWQDFHEVVTVQVARRDEIPPNEVFTLPDLWASRDTLFLVGEAVHDEYPGSLQQELIEWLWRQGAPLDHDIIPFRSNSDFVGRNIAMVALNTWAIGHVSPRNFYLKWYAGRARPEEVAHLISIGEITEAHGVPHDIVTAIQNMNLDPEKEGRDFTSYEEGAPRHPAWPAMHSAASSASFWVAIVLDLTPEQYCEALRVDYATAYARTVAGVHYPTDNTAGLNLGQAIVAESLPHHLATEYGADPKKVRAKIEKYRFDWRNFDSSDCSMSMPF